MFAQFSLTDRNSATEKYFTYGICIEKY